MYFMPLLIRFTLIWTTVTLSLVHRVAIVIDNFYWLIIVKAFVVAFKLFSVWWATPMVFISSLVMFPARLRGMMLCAFAWSLLIIALIALCKSPIVLIVYRTPLGARATKVARAR